MAGRLLLHLPEELDAIVMNKVPLNAILCAARLVCKATAAYYRRPLGTKVRLSQPVPRHAFSRRCEANDRAWIKSLTRDRRLQLLCLTAATGDLANLQVAVRAAGLVLRSAVMEAAAAAGHIHVCQWLRQQGCPWGFVFYSAAVAGQRKMCEWLLVSGVRITLKTVESAFEGGHVALAEWLRQQMLGEPDSKELVDAAALGCDLPTLQELFLAWWQKQQQRNQEQTELVQYSTMNTLINAARSPTPDWRDKMQWLESQGCREFHTHACMHAACLPDAVERLRWLLPRGYLLGTEAVYEAVSSGNTAALEFLLGEAGVVLYRNNEEEACVSAAREGHLAVLQVLHTRGVAMVMSNCLRAAAAHGHLAVVEWLVGAFRLGVEDLQAHAVREALESGSMELLTWLEERGCDLGGGQLVLGVNSEAALEWQVARGRELPSTGCLYVEAVAAGDLAALACLRRLDCPWGSPGDCLLSRCLRESSDPYLATMRWLVDAGCPVDWAQAVMEVHKQWRCVPVKWVAVKEWVMEEVQQREQRRESEEGGVEEGERQVG